MQDQDENLPSSIARERGLVWLEGWFDLSAALSAQKSEREEWQDISTAPIEEEVLFGYYGSDMQWHGHFWKGHLFQWEKMPAALATGSCCRHMPTHWRKIEPPAIRNLKIEVDDAG